MLLENAVTATNNQFVVGTDTVTLRRGHSYYNEHWSLLAVISGLCPDYHEQAVDLTMRAIH